MQLSPDQMQALDAGEAVPVVIGDKQCVLLSSGLYEQLRHLISDWELNSMQRHLAHMMADDWCDPAMSAYDD